MRSALPTVITKRVKYPTTDGKPMAETALHGRIMTDARDIVEAWFADDRWTYAWGNMLVFYEKGNPRKHVAPDVFVARVSKSPPRDHFLIWAEGRAPEWVLEITSKTTAEEDLKEKFRIYRDSWKVREYCLFDPRAEYLDPPLQGYRLRGRRFVPIRMIDGRLPCEVLGLQLEQRGTELRFYDPANNTYLVTAREKLAEVEQARRQAEAEVERLRRELEELRGRTS